MEVAGYIKGVMYFLSRKNDLNNDNNGFVKWWEPALPLLLRENANNPEVRDPIRKYLEQTGAAGKYKLGQAVKIILGAILIGVSMGLFFSSIVLPVIVLGVAAGVGLVLAGHSAYKLASSGYYNDQSSNSSPAFHSYRILSDDVEDGDDGEGHSNVRDSYRNPQ